MPIARLRRLIAGLLFCLSLLMSGRAVAATEPQPAPADEAALADADQLNRQAMQLYIQKKYPEATAAAQRMLDIRKNALGPNHSSTVQAMLIVAQCYKAQQDYANAEPLFEKVFAIREKQLGPTEKGTTDVMRVLAGVYEAREKYDAATPLRKRLLAVAEQQHGPDSPEIDDQIYRLASLYSKKGDHDTAAEQFL